MNKAKKESKNKGRSASVLGGIAGGVVGGIGGTMVAHATTTSDEQPEIADNDTIDVIDIEKVESQEVNVDENIPQEMLNEEEGDLSIDISDSEEGDDLLVDVSDFEEETEPQNNDIIGEDEVLEDEILTDADEFNVDIVEYESVQDDEVDMDLAVLNVDGENVTVVDTDTDGYADTIQIDEGSSDELFIDVTEDNISMEVLQNDFLQIQDDSYIENNPDYTNDADVDDFMI